MSLVAGVCASIQTVLYVRVVGAVGSDHVHGLPPRYVGRRVHCLIVWAVLTLLLVLGGHLPLGFCRLRVIPLLPQAELALCHSPVLGDWWWWSVSGADQVGGGIAEPVTDCPCLVHDVLSLVALQERSLDGSVFPPAACHASTSHSG
jgi:hypothetical protein